MLSPIKSITHLYILLIISSFLLCCSSPQSVEPDLPFKRVAAPFLPQDTVRSIKKRVESQPRHFQKLPEKEGVALNIPLSYRYEQADNFPIDLIYREASDNEDTIIQEQDQALQQKERFFTIESAFLKDVDLSETVMVADTTLADSVILNSFKRATIEEHHTIDYSIYEDSHTYIGVTGFGDIVIYYFSPAAQPGKRIFYYAVADDTPPAKDQATQLAFELLQNAKALNAHADSSLPNAKALYESLNLLEKQSMDRLTNSVKKEAEAFLDTGTVARYALSDDTDILLAHEADVAQTMTCIERLPLNKPGQSCDSDDASLPAKKRFIDLGSYTSVALDQYDKEQNLMLLSGYESWGFEDHKETRLKSQICILNCTVNKKRFILAIVSKAKAGLSASTIQDLARYFGQRITS